MLNEIPAPIQLGKKSILNLYFYALVVLFLSYLFMGGDCGTDNEDPGPPKTVAPPVDLSLKIGADPIGTAGSSFAVVSWSASTDENNSDFRGYRVITVELNANNQFVSVYNEQALSKSVHTYTLPAIGVNTKYRSYVTAELTDGTRSDSLETEIYAGVYFNTNGSIDSHTSSGNSQSGYGWDINTGSGTQYTFNQANSNKIDLHLREETTGILFFKSPDFLDDFAGTNYRFTRMNLIGYGQETFDEYTADEPDRTEAPVSEDGVYLMMTEDGNYIKVWVKSIEQTGNPSYFNVIFDYKVQPIAALRVVKR